MESMTLSRWIIVIVTGMLAVTQSIQTHQPGREIVVVRDRLEEILVQWECGGTPLRDCLRVRHDGDNLVVGVGHDIQPKDMLWYGGRITVQQMNDFLQEDINIALQGAAILVDDYATHPPNVQVVIAAMVFQLGYQGTSKFKRALAAVNAGEYAVASDEMLDSKWARQTPNRAQAMAALMHAASAHHAEGENP